jgi:hypothetical protein
MEYYDPSTDKWTLLDSASVAREGKVTLNINLNKKTKNLNFVKLIKAPAWFRSAIVCTVLEATTA